jgi:hypothetical protein
MSPEFQTVAALIVVALAAAYLFSRAFRKRKNPGCGTDCGAISPQMRKLQARLKRRP